MVTGGAIVLTIPAFITLIVLFFWIALSGVGNNNNENNGEYRPWYDFDLRPEDMESIKITMHLLVLIVACGTLFSPIKNAASAVYDYERFNSGMLAASMFMFGNMLFVSFWYLVNFGRREEENNDGYNGYNQYWMDDEQLLAYHQKVVSFVVLALALAFFVVAAIIHDAGEMLPQTLHGNNIQHSHAHVNAAARFETISETWSFLSLCNIVVFVSLFIAALLLLGAGEVERMVEEARVVNLIAVLVWMSIVAIVMMMKGNAIFTEKRRGSLGVGIVYGGTKYFAALLFMICILFANLSFDEGQQEEGVWVSTATSIACLVLSLLHFVFSMRVRKYQVSIYDANTEQAVVMDSQAVIHTNVGGDFVRVDETGLQVR